MTARPVLRSAALLTAMVAAGLGACTPTVKIEAPDKPIEINLNVRIEQEVRVKLERDVEKVIQDDPALFGLPPAGPPKGETAKGETGKGKAS